LPAGAHVVRKEMPAKPPVEEQTRIISADQLESKIRQSNEHDAPTRVSVDIAKMLPRVPPGADDIDDDGATADITDVLSPQPFTRAKTPSQAKPGIKKPPTVQIPVRTKAPSGAPIAMLKKDESGRVVIPTKDVKSGPVVIPLAKMAKALKQSPPSDEAVTVHQKKPPADEATTIRATPKRTPTPAPEPIAAAGSAPVKQAVPVEATDADADASASGSRPMTLDDSQIEEINEELAPRRRPATTPPPTPIIAEIRARRREPTPLPLLAKRPDDDLPQGRFNYPMHRNRSGRRIAIFLVLAFVAAGAGIAFVHFVLQRPHKPAGEPKTDLAVVPAVVPDAAEPAPPPPPPPVVADAEIPEIEIEIPANPPPPPPPHHPATHHPIVTPIDAGAASTSNDAGAASEDGCDEVTCVMEKYEKPCCARFKPTDDANYRPHVGVPGGLDKVMVREAMENVKPRVIACGEQNGAKGTVKLAIVVAPDGSVRSVSVTDSPQPALGTCVAAAVKAAQFEKTAKGGSFNYPFVF
jgi:TonB family protein